MLRPDTMPRIIINVEEGTNCGNVEQILFNRKRKCIDSFVVSKLDENGVPLKEDDVEYILPFSDLEGMGDYAIIIMRDSLILKKRGHAEREEFYLGKSTLIGDIVISLKGNKIGTVIDYEFSEEGDISSIFVELNKHEKVERFDSFNMMSIGNGIVIVRTPELDVFPFKRNENFQDFVKAKENIERKHDWNMTSRETTHMGGKDEGEEIALFTPKMEVVREVGKKEVVFSESETEKQTKDMFENELEFRRESVETVAEQIQAAEEPVETVAEQVEEKPVEIAVSERRRHPKSNEGLVEDNQLIQKFIDKQKVLLLGRVLTRDILDAEGNILLMKGTKITEDIFDVARKARTDAIVEMAMFSA